MQQNLIVKKNCGYRDPLNLTIAFSRISLAFLALSMSINQRIKNELIRRAKEDQKMRKRALEVGYLDTLVDRRNTETLKTIISRYGWPTKSLVGNEGSYSAWLLAQHADHNVPFQKLCLKLMRQAYHQNPNDIKKEYIIFLQERIKINNEKPIG